MGFPIPNGGVVRMKSFLFVLLGAFSLSACAQSPAPEGEERGAESAAPAAAEVEVDPETADGRALAAIRKLNPRVTVDRVGPAPIDGFREVVVGGQVLYVSDDGRYLLQGALFDVEARQDLSQAGLAEVRRELIAEVPQSDRIVFAPDDPKHTVTVFTDVECGYCRKLHEQIDEYNRQGIAIEYLAFPRMGPASPDFEEMVSVWCSDDRRQALTDAKSDKRVPKRNCTNPVAMHYALGQRIGLTGTPMIVTESGMQMPGYMPPQALREALEQLDAEAAGG